MSINAEAWAEMKVAPHEHQQMYAGQDDTSFLISSFDNDALPPTVLRQLQQYTSRIDTSSLDDPEQSMGSPQMLSSPLIPPSGAMPKSHSPERFHSVTSYVPNQKRKLVDSGNVA